MRDAGHFAPYRVKLAVRGEGQQVAAKSALWPQQRLVFEGELEVLSPYEVPPQAEVSFLLADNLCCTMRMRLPLSLALFLVSADISTARFGQLWTSPEFCAAEVACVFAVAPIFVEAGGFFYFSKGLELGGALQIIHGADESPDSLALAGCMEPASLVLSSVASSSAASEVLVRAELGSPSGDRATCRLTVRSASYLVSRGISQVLLDVLCK